MKRLYSSGWAAGEESVEPYAGILAARASAELLCAAAGSSPGVLAWGNARSLAWDIPGVPAAGTTGAAQAAEARKAGRQAKARHAVREDGHAVREDKRFMYGGYSTQRKMSWQERISSDNA